MPVHSPTATHATALRVLRRAAVLLALIFTAQALTGCKTISRKELEEKYPLRAKYSPRWETNEVPYAETNAVDKGGRNVRDGLVGVVNNFVQAAFALFTIAPTSGYVVQKVSVMTGDVIGLLDDNAITEHIFLGIISRQFLRFGTGVQDINGTLSSIHDTTFDGPVISTLDIVGPDTFHTKAYGKPSALFTAVAVVGGDLVVRPAGNFVLMFGGRETSKKIDQFGLDLIQLGMDVPFL